MSRAIGALSPQQFLTAVPDLGLKLAYFLEHKLLFSINHINIYL